MIQNAGVNCFKRLKNIIHKVLKPACRQAGKAQSKQRKNRINQSFVIPAYTAGRFA